MKTVNLNGKIQYPDNDLQAKYDKLKESHDRIEDVLKKFYYQIGTHGVVNSGTALHQLMKLALEQTP